MISEHPHQVAIWWRTIFLCGGSIIGTQWILTAAHCLNFNTVHYYSVRVGSTFYDKDGLLVGVKRKIVHEKYNRATVDFDFGLLQLRNLLVFSDTVQMIALPESDNVADNANAVVTGWGAKNEVC